MNIAIISDIHNNESKLLTALHAIGEAGADCLICLGDMHTGRSLRLLRENWDSPLYFVLGNNDWPARNFEQLCRQWEFTEFHGDAGDITLGGRRIYFTHYPHYAQRAAELGRYDAVFFGHTHEAMQIMHHHTLLLNPGELECRRSKGSWAMYDSDTNTACHHPLS